MKFVKERDKVHILCEAKLEDGTVFYKNDEKNILEFVVGEGKFFPAVENAIRDMKEGETKTILLEPEDAYGPYNDGLVVNASKDSFRSDKNMGIGSKVKIKTPSGKMILGIIIEVNDGTFTVDFNHPLAGKRIMFTVTIVTVVE